MTTTPCVSLTTGTLSPDERVNYTFGMVLGVDDFQQEQTYGLFKDHLHERALHGYGTVSGLAVTVAPIESDYQVTVSSGIGIDQWGREFAITCDQCARLGSWLAAQEGAGHGLAEHPPGPSGEITVYVVASYQQCLEDEVPIPGSPCSTGLTSAPSRIRDAWDVELSWTPPPMPRWDSDRRLARLLGRVTVVPDLDPSLSDEPKIIDAVRGLSELADSADMEIDPPPVGSPPEPPTWKLPAEQASAALDRILTVWVTEVRPGLAQELYSPETAASSAADSVPPRAAVLLSTITFVPGNNFDKNAPVITWCGDPDDEGRPYLLHTQLIQELASLLAGIEEVVEVPATELVTLTATADENAVVNIDAWFHLPEGVLLPQTLAVVDEDGFTMEYQTVGFNEAGTASDRWRLTSEPNGTSGIADGLQFSLLLPADTVHVGGAATTLRGYIANTGINLLDQDSNGDVTAYGVIHMQQHIPAATPQPFVTVTPLSSNSDMSIFEFWFHLEPTGHRDAVTVAEFAVEVFDDWSSNTGEAGTLNVSQTPSQSGWANARLIRVIPGPTQKGNAQYLRFVIPAGKFAMTTPDGSLTLREWIAKTGVNYQGWDEAADEIVVFARSPLPQAPGQPNLDGHPDVAGGGEPQ